MAVKEQLPVLIIGAGVVGLTLAQALKKKNIPALAFERDTNADARGQGWAITIHWALPCLEALLPPDLFALIDEVQVDPINGKRDKGNFLFLNLQDGSIKFRIPPSARKRVGREKLRRLLMDGLNINWGKRLVGIKDNDDDGVSAVFSDGSTVAGSLLVGVDGSSSTVRRMLSASDDEAVLKQLPYRFMGVTATYTPAAIAPLRALDPLLFQGCHPETGVFLWYSTLETPEATGNGLYKAQLNLSWPVRSPADEVPTDNSERVAFLKAKASRFCEPFRSAILGIEDDAEVVEIKLADWDVVQWDNHRGRATLAGDAAHAMTMYRGEAANHGLMDALKLFQAIESVWDGVEDQEVAIGAYEAEIMKRAPRAVKLSRQACIDAHQWENLKEGCAVLSRRSID